MVWPRFPGKRTANGETFNTNDLSAAHKTLPFGTKVRVTNEKTGNRWWCGSTTVPVRSRRVIDLSKPAAQAVGIEGVGQVTLAAL